MTTDTRNPIPIGTQFRSTYADSNSLFEVVDHYGPGAVDAVILNEPFEISPGSFIDGDYAGIRKGFSVEDVQASLKFADSVSRVFAASDDFWANVEVGTQLHYHNGFGQFVRGVVVLDDDTLAPTLLPTALVNGVRLDDGKAHGWSAWELPHWNNVGEVVNPYHVQKIIDGETWNPSPSTIWEASARLQNEYERPDNGVAQDLNPPTRTDEELLAQAKRSLANEAIALLQRDDPDLKGAADLIERWAVHGVS